MRCSARLCLALTLSAMWLGSSAAAQATAEPRIPTEVANQRITTLLDRISERTQKIQERYSYETVHETIRGAAGPSRSEIERFVKPLGARIYALWAGLHRRVRAESDRLRENQATFKRQGFALERDVDWLE